MNTQCTMPPEARRPRFRLLLAICIALACGSADAAAPVGPVPLVVAAGAAITGGGPDAEIVTIDAASPAAQADLERALCASRDRQGRCSDSQPRLIRLSGVVDYRGADGGVITARGCVYSDRSCTYKGRQERILDVMGYCRGKPLIDVSYQASGTHPLLVGSNKTVLGIGTHAGLTGKGLVIKGGARNVIVRNLNISDINEGVIWGGDAIQIDDARDISIDHDNFARVGRQFIAVGTHVVSHLLISANLFDGRSDYGHYCDGRHYWNILFDGPGQSARVEGNWFYRTAGRAPQVETAGPQDAGGVIHIVNNYYSENSHVGIVTHGQVLAVVEGNDFAGVPARTGFAPLLASKDGMDLAIAPFPDTAGDGSLCRTLLGRRCVANRAEGWSSDRFRINDATVAALRAAPDALEAVRTWLPVTASRVPVQVSAAAGPQERCSAQGC
jgi:pectin lyase